MQQQALELGYHAGNLHWRIRFDGDALLVRMTQADQAYFARFAPSLTASRCGSMAGACLQARVTALFAALPVSQRAVSQWLPLLLGLEEPSWPRVRLGPADFADYLAGQLAHHFGHVRPGAAPCPCPTPQAGDEESYKASTLAEALASRPLAPAGAVHLALLGAHVRLRCRPSAGRVRASSRPTASARPVGGGAGGARRTRTGPGGWSLTLSGAPAAGGTLADRLSDYGFNSRSMPNWHFGGSPCSTTSPSAGAGARHHLQPAGPSSLAMMRHADLSQQAAQLSTATRGIDTSDRPPLNLTPDRIDRSSSSAQPNTLAGW